jgi:radical SAM protein with 4Fe4S-binding SPASM domain
MYRRRIALQTIVGRHEEQCLMHSPFRHAGSILAKKRPIHLTFFVTRKCNAACPYCFYLKSTNAPVSKKPELTLAEIQNVARSTGKLLWLALSGGEIYLRKDLVDICVAFYDHCRPSVILLPTNGLQPEVIARETVRVLEQCSDSVVVVKLSLDGVGADHDDFRNTRGNFEKVLETYERLEKLLPCYANFELGINTTLQSRNQGKITEIIDYVGGFENNGTHTVSLVRGDLQQANYKQVNPDNYSCAAKELESRLKNKLGKMYRFRGAKLKAAQDILQRRLIYQTLVSGEKSIPCYAGKLNLVLTEYGEVYPCEILPDSFGNIRDYDYDLLRVVKTAKANQIRSTISNNNPLCKTCTHECNYMMNILFNPAMYPSLVREYLKL